MTHQRCNAGQAAEFIIWQYDQYGNKVTERAEPGLFLAHATGPGAMQTDITAQDTGTVTIMYVYAIAGGGLHCC